MQIASECNRRHSLMVSEKLPVKPFVVTMGLAMAGFGVIVAWLSYWHPQYIPSLGLVQGITFISLSWVPVLLIKTFYRGRQNNGK